MDRNKIKVSLSITRLALANVLTPFGVHLLIFTLPSALMHYLGSPEFPVICDTSHITTHTRLHHNTQETYLIYPMIAISENTWSFDYFWHSVGLQVFRSEGLLNLLSLLSNNSYLFTTALCVF